MKAELKIQLHLLCFVTRRNILEYVLGEKKTPNVLMHNKRFLFVSSAFTVDNRDVLAGEIYSRYASRKR